MITIARHDSGPFAEWEPMLRQAVRSWQDVRRNLPEMPAAAADLVGYARERAALASLNPEMDAALCLAIEQGAAAAAAAFCAICYEGGEVSVDLADGTQTVAAVGPTSGTHPGRWLTAVSLALIADDTVALTILVRERTIRQAIASAYELADFWPPLMRGFQALWQGDTAVWQQQAEIADQAIRLHADEDGDIAALIAPLLPLGTALLTADAALWQQSLATALTQHRDYWSVPEYQYDNRGFLALAVAGLWALGRRRGLRANVVSGYVPAVLVNGRCQPKPSNPIYHFPPHPARNTMEAHLFMALQGCDGSEQQHLETEGDTFYTIYHCQPDKGEQVVFTFEMLDKPTASAQSQLIDAGQFFLLAEQFAQVVPTELDGLTPKEQQQIQYKLNQAIACLEEVLLFIPPAAKQVPEAAFWTEMGRAVYHQSPAQFTRERLLVIWEAWTQLRVSLFPEAAEAAAQRQALALTEVIAGMARPLLQSLIGPEQQTILAKIRPRPDDYAKVFVPAAAAAAQAAYEPLWAEGMQIKIADAQTELEIHVSPAGMLGDENTLSHPFPQGYRRIAEFLNPHRTWIAWKYVRPGEHSGMAFNGLVWLDDHWAWFPKPYRALQSFLSEA